MTAADQRSGGRPDHLSAVGSGQFSTVRSGQSSGGRFGQSGGGPDGGRAGQPDGGQPDGGRRRCIVELVRADRTYPGVSPVTALKPTDLRVHAGDSVAITGRSGSGKSTLLYLLGLLDRPSAGQYLLDGVDTAGLSDAARTRLRGQRIGFVFQSFHLLAHRSAIENVRLALLYHRCPRRERWRRAAESLERVGLAHRANALPTTMSGGERQRVAVARALAIRPAVLLADEPTGNLDSTTADDVLALFDDLHRDGQTIIVVTHDPAVAARARRQLRIHDGTVTEISTMEYSDAAHASRPVR